ARAFLVGHHGLRRPVRPSGAAGVRALLGRLRCIQLDPLDVLGTNADLVALARIDGIARGDVYGHLLPGHAFEHIAKERCLLPASAFPYYRDHAPRLVERHLDHHLSQVDDAVLGSVLDEVRRRGPLTADELDDRGRVRPINWSGGWRGTARATSMA